jgi:hypothetical protein
MRITLRQTNSNQPALAMAMAAFRSGLSRLRHPRLTVKRSTCCRRFLAAAARFIFIPMVSFRSVSIDEAYRMRVAPWENSFRKVGDAGSAAIV